MSSTTHTHNQTHTDNDNTGNFWGKNDSQHPLPVVLVPLLCPASDATPSINQHCHSSSSSLLLPAMTTPSGNTSKHRCIKLALDRLITPRNKNLVSTIDKFVIFNLQIAVCGSMIMNYLAVHCVSNNLPLPNLDHKLIYQAFASYDNIDPIKLQSSYIEDECLLHVVMETRHVFPPPFNT